MTADDVHAVMPVAQFDAHAAKARFDALLSTAADGIIVISRDGTVDEYNPACERLFGYPRNQVIGQNVKILMPSPYWEQHDDYLRNYAESGKRKIIGIGREVIGRKKDGSTFPMYLSVGEGEADGQKMYVGIIHDLSDQKRVLARAHDREARLSSILDTGLDAIIMIDDRGMIEIFSGSASRLFGFEPAEAIGRNVNMLMPAPYRGEHDRYIARYKETGEKRIIGKGRIVVAQRRDGSIFPMELAVGEVQVSGRTMFTGFIRDITDKQAAERRAQDLQAELLHISRLTAMGQMASALAHELNQPLFAMTNYLSAASSMLGNASDPPLTRVRELIEKANAQTLRAGQTIQRLRAFIQKGESVRTDEALNSVVEEAIAISMLHAGQSSIKLTTRFHPSLPPVSMDKVQIQQVILNLVRNAIEAMAETPRRELMISTAVAGEGWASVAIEDTGPGLPANVAEKLFKPFVTTKEKGMGVGLSISYSIIDAHGGKLWAEPRSGGGTVFKFTLPFAEHSSDDP